MSINLCTDQLAMLLAAPGQLVAVSYLARDPRASTMPDAAMAHDITYGQAEEVFLRRPDLVLAGTYTTRATVELLRRLGVRVEELPVVESLQDVGTQMRAVGRLLGRPAEGERLAAAFEAGLAALRREVARRPRAALYYANGWTGGRASLAGEILAAAGFANVAEAGGILPLEQLLLARPELVITGEPYPGASRAEEILAHPALLPLRREGAIADAEWVCGLPGVLKAIARLGALQAEVAR
ncbi:MAG: ABC transporter substrate-binding protein [Rhodobacteraceae bacterium]|nr:ABC transporter substrate-binding protein [Paracoccaceae bacterium]